MQPVRVKVYGFLSLTRRQYLGTLLGALVLLAALAPLWFAQGQEYVQQFFLQRSPALAWLVPYIPWAVLAAIGLEGIEAFFVLRKFSRLEAEQRLLNEPPPPGPSPR